MSVAPWSTFTNPFPTPVCRFYGCRRPVFMMGKVCLGHLPKSPEETSPRWNEPKFEHPLNLDAVK